MAGGKGVSVTILQGDVFDRMAELPSDHFDVVVTSPPYWGLRSYLPTNHPLKHFEIGSEPTLGEHIGVLVRLFREVRRIMKPTGTCWLNYGDCYATSPNGRSAANTKATGKDDRTFRDKPFSTVGGSLKAKDLCMIPNRLAIALQDDGWWVRSEIIWGKLNPMPDSSGRYRPSTAHEKIFELTKTGRSFYDAEAVRMERHGEEDANDSPGGERDECGARGPRLRRSVGNKIVDKQSGHSRRHQGFNDRWDKMEKSEQIANGRLLRNYEPAPLEVWPFATAPFSGAHFATFPPELVYRCLRTAPKGCCPHCGAPWRRVVVQGEIDAVWQSACGGDAFGGYNGQSTKDFGPARAQDASAVKARVLAGMRERVTTGWEQSCECEPAEPVPARVLDPFGGAGTVGLVADRIGLNCTLIELNPESVTIARDRIEDDSPLFAEVAAE